VTFEGHFGNVFNSMCAADVRSVNNSCRRKRWQQVRSTERLIDASQTHLFIRC